MSVDCRRHSAASLSGREIPTLEALYEAAGGVNFTPGWVTAQEADPVERAAAGVRARALDL